MPSSYILKIEEYVPAKRRLVFTILYDVTFQKNNLHGHLEILKSPYFFRSLVSSCLLLLIENMGDSFVIWLFLSVVNI
jgi:hypothetical protein